MDCSSGPGCRWFKSIRRDQLLTRQRVDLHRIFGSHLSVEALSRRQTSSADRRTITSQGPFPTPKNCIHAEIPSGPVAGLLEVGFDCRRRRSARCRWLTTARAARTPNRNHTPAALYVMEASCAVRFVFLIGYIGLTADGGEGIGRDASLAIAEGTARVEDQESGSRKPRNRE